ncbi:MAG: DUF2062 domain-containing protein [Chitinophagales bacterium]
MTKAASVATGLFWGLSPFWGFHTGGAVVSAILFKLNKPITILASNVSLPPFIPFLIFASYKVGGWWLGKNAMHIEFNQLLSPAAIQKNLLQYVIGSLTLAVVIPALTGALVYWMAKKHTAPTNILEN